MEGPGGRCIGLTPPAGAAAPRVVSCLIELRVATDRDSSKRTDSTLALHALSLLLSPKKLRQWIVDVGWNRFLPVSSLPTL